MRGSRSRRSTPRGRAAPGIRALRSGPIRRNGSGSSRCGDGTPIFVRPVRPEDEPLIAPFFAAVTQQDLRLRFFAPVKEFSHAFIARFTQIDYARAMAFIAIDEATGEMLGVVRLHANANYDSGEYAILVRSDLKGRGLGWLLMQMIIEYARSRRPADDRGPGAARKHHDAGDVPGTRLRSRTRPGRSGHLLVRLPVAP